MDGGSLEIAPLHLALPPNHRSPCAPGPVRPCPWFSLLFLGGWLGGGLEQMIWEGMRPVDPQSLAFSPAPHEGEGPSKRKKISPILSLPTLPSWLPSLPLGPRRPGGQVK